MSTADKPYVEIANRNSSLWAYLPLELQDLIRDGEIMVEHAREDKDRLSDFSYLVFPFSKAYEGFLKKLFLDLDLIREDEYYSDDIRIGRILNPHFVKQGGNIFDHLCTRIGDKRRGKEVAEKLWAIWKKGRNQVFHYFPHNFRRLSYDEAFEIIKDIVGAMSLAVGACRFSAGAKPKADVASQVSSIL